MTLAGGIATIRIKSTMKVGNVTITATGTGLTDGTTSFITVPGTSSKLSITLNKQTLKADGSDETGFNVYVRDYNDNITNEIRNIKLEILNSDGYGVIVTTGGITVSSITVAASNGQVSGLKLRSGIKTGTLTLTAGSPGLASASQDITLIPDAAKKLWIKCDSPCPYLSSDGISSTTIKLELLDMNGNKVSSPDYPVTISINSFGLIGLIGMPVTESQVSTYTVNGEARLILKSTIKSGVAELAAESAGLDSAILQIDSLPLSPAKIKLTVDHPTIVADGISQTTVHASIADINDNIVTGRTDTVVFTLEGDGEWGELPYGKEPKVKNISGSETSIVIKSSMTAGVIKVHVTTGLHQGVIDVNTIAGTIDHLVLLYPGVRYMTADGISKTTVTVQAVDRNSNLINDYNGELNMTTVGPAQENSKQLSLVNGTTSFTITSQLRSGEVKVKITSLILGCSVETILDSLPGKVNNIRLDAADNKNQLISDGVDTTRIVATLWDRNDNIVNTATNTVTFFVTGDVVSAVKEVISSNGTSSCDVKSSTRTGTVTVTAAVKDVYSGLVLSTATLQLGILPQPVARSIILGIKSGSTYIITADSASETVVEAKIVDVNGNLIDSANNTVIFNLTGNADLVSGTGLVSTVYADAVNGTSHVKIRSRNKSGTVIVSAVAAGLTGSSATVITRPGPALKLDFSITDIYNQFMSSYITVTSLVKLKTVIKDVNGNVCDDYSSPVLVNVSNNGYIETSSTSIPMNGIVETVIRAGVSTGVLIITTKTGILVSTKELVVIPLTQSSLIVNVSPKVIYSMGIATVTVTLVDSLGNLAIMNTPINVTFRSDYGRFSMNNGSLTGSQAFTFVMNKNSVEVLYTGIQEGVCNIVCESEGLKSGYNIIVVYASTVPAKIDVDISTIVYVPSNITAAISLVDENDNKILTVGRYVNFIATNSSGRIVTSSDNVKLVNGTVQLVISIDNPGMYTIKCWSGILKSKIIRVSAMVNKVITTVLKHLNVNGNVKLEIPKNSMLNDIVIEINDYDKTWQLLKGTNNNALIRNTAVNLAAKDRDNNELSDSQVFAVNKFFSLTIPYLDMGQDGIVDGTKFKETDLRICRLENAIGVH
jgi:hypothetical protein